MSVHVVDTDMDKLTITKSHMDQVSFNHRLYNRTISEWQSYSIHTLSSDIVNHLPYSYIMAFIIYQYVLQSLPSSFCLPLIIHTFLYTVINHLSSSSVLKEVRGPIVYVATVPRSKGFEQVVPLRPRNHLIVHIVQKYNWTKIYHDNNYGC